MEAQSPLFFKPFFMKNFKSFLSYVGFILVIAGVILVVSGIVAYSYSHFIRLGYYLIPGFIIVVIGLGLGDVANRT